MAIAENGVSTVHQGAIDHNGAIRSRPGATARSSYPLHYEQFTGALCQATLYSHGCRRYREPPSVETVFHHKLRGFLTRQTTKSANRFVKPSTRYEKRMAHHALILVMRHSPRYATSTNYHSLIVYYDIAVFSRDAVFILCCSLFIPHAMVPHCPHSQQSQSDRQDGHFSPTLKAK